MAHHRRRKMRTFKVGSWIETQKIEVESSPRGKLHRQGRKMDKKSYRVEPRSGDFKKKKEQRHGNSSKEILEYDINFFVKLDEKQTARIID